MNEKREPFENEVPKHRKKSKKKGRPRADHKHEYKTVLLIREWENPYKPGEKHQVEFPNEICMICGRIGDIDYSMYEFVEIHNMPYRIHERNIKNKETLEKWYVDDYFDKFAKKMEEA